MRPWWFLASLLCSGCLVPDSFVEAVLDRDGDGWRTDVIGGGDCDDGNPDVNPRGVEICGNDLDDDCDGTADLTGIGAKVWFFDGDGDGFGTATRDLLRCTKPRDHVEDSSDCDDGRDDIHPGAEDVCGNGLDEDCDLIIDNGGDPRRYWRDYDGDGAARRTDFIEACSRPPGYIDKTRSAYFDCNDLDPTISPLATESWYDGVDQDCFGANDYDMDGDSFTVSSALVQVPSILRSDAEDCDDTNRNISPTAPEIPYDGIDQNCDPTDDDDADLDGYPAALHGGTDCDDTDPAIHPGAVEIPYDRIDQDCDPSNEWDGDGDGQVVDPTTPENLVLLAGIRVPPGAGGTDCHDGDASIFLGAPEVCDGGPDQDCDGDLIEEFDCDADGYTAEGAPAGSADDCDDTDPDIHPGRYDPPYDGRDVDCGDRDDFDADGDGQTWTFYGGTDCDDRDPTVFLGAPELCEDGVDQDCDGGLTCGPTGHFDLADFPIDLTLDDWTVDGTPSAGPWHRNPTRHLGVFLARDTTADPVDTTERLAIVRLDRSGASSWLAAIHLVDDADPSFDSTFDGLLGAMLCDVQDDLEPELLVWTEAWLFAFRSADVLPGPSGPRPTILHRTPSQAAEIVDLRVDPSGVDAQAAPWARCLQGPRKAVPVVSWYPHEPGTELAAGTGFAVLGDVPWGRPGSGHSSTLHDAASDWGVHPVHPGSARSMVPTFSPASLSTAPTATLQVVESERDPPRVLVKPLSLAGGLSTDLRDPFTRFDYDGFPAGPEMAVVATVPDAREHLFLDDLDTVALLDESGDPPRIWEPALRPDPVPLRLAVQGGPFGERSATYVWSSPDGTTGGLAWAPGGPRVTGTASPPWTLAIDPAERPRIWPLDVDDDGDDDVVLLLPGAPARFLWLEKPSD